jgi:hypothetical protein
VCTWNVDNEKAYGTQPLTFERKVLRKIIGLNNQTDGSWRIKANKELEKLIKRKTIVREIQSGKI